MDLGIVNAARTSVPNPLPQSWIGRADAPLAPPSWTTIAQLSSAQIKNLLAQIGYDLSAWDYNKIGEHNELGRYQFTSTLLESYGLLAPGSNNSYGNDCVNYRTCWRPAYSRTDINSYANYIYNVTNLREFLNSTVSQEHLAYQYLIDLHTDLLKIDAILETDPPDVVAGMVYVAWQLGVGSGPNNANPQGTGAYAWRYYNVGSGADYYNSGRYAIVVLGQ